MRYFIDFDDDLFKKFVAWRDSNGLKRYNAEIFNALLKYALDNLDFLRTLCLCLSYDVREYNSILSKIGDDDFI